MDGERIRKFWANEAEALLRTYRQFETLVPSAHGKGSAHPGEDGRYVEALVRSYVRRIVPRGLEVLTGFILRPAVKTASSGRERKGETDQCSRQLDIIVFDSTRYPVFQRFEDAAVVPPEGVVAVISVKKTLRKNDIPRELEALAGAARLCRCLTADGKRKLQSPFLALVGLDSDIKKPWETMRKGLQDAYLSSSPPAFDETVGCVAVLSKWSTFKLKPRDGKQVARYVNFAHDSSDGHLFFQVLGTGILSVAYDKTRNTIRRPGFTAFEAGKVHTDDLELPVRSE